MMVLSETAIFNTIYRVLVNLSRFINSNGSMHRGHSLDADFAFSGYSLAYYEGKSCLRVVEMMDSLLSVGVGWHCTLCGGGLRAPKCGGAWGILAACCSWGLWHPTPAARSWHALKWYTPHYLVFSPSLFAALTLPTCRPYNASLKTPCFKCLYWSIFVM